MKTSEMKTKRKQKNEAQATEGRGEIDEFFRQEKNVDEVHDFLLEQYTATAKSREILEEYYEDKENTGERSSKN